MSIDEAEFRHLDRRRKIWARAIDISPVGVKKRRVLLRTQRMLQAKLSDVCLYPQTGFQNSS